MHARSIAALAFLVFTSGVQAAAPDNAALAGIFREDQADRGTCADDDPCLRSFPGDKARQAAVMEQLRNGLVRTANDYVHAAVIFQHSTSADDNALAHALASVAARIDPQHRFARFLAAAAWDRTLMRRNKPQWYGTQLAKSQRDDRWEVYRVDESAVTDEDRKAMGVPSLAQSREAARKFNRS